MGRWCCLSQIAATVTDAADIRSYECTLPDSVRVSRIALRLAEMMHLPVAGSDGNALRYGLIPRGGELIEPNTTLADVSLPHPLTLRLVPEITAGSDDLVAQDESQAESSGEDDDFEITIGEPTALVHDVELVARPDVRIDAAVHKKIEQFAAANRNKECAGLLLGVVDSEENNNRIIHITAAIPAEGAVGTRASVRIPLKVWEAVLKIRDLDYSELRILGWFHTHAGWGVFMSDADVFIHRHFFPHPSMVAYVLDPTTGRDGFFYWHEGKIGLCPSYGLVGAPSEVKPQKSAGKAAGVQSPRRRFDAKNVIIGALVIGVLYLGFAGSPFAKRSHHMGAVEKKNPAVDSKQIVVTKEVANKAAASRAARIYAIGPNDNPWRICNRVYNDGELGPALMKYNGLDPNPNLQIGQKIKLPQKDTLVRLLKQK